VKPFISGWLAEGLVPPASLVYAMLEKFQDFLDAADKDSSKNYKITNFVYRAPLPSTTFAKTSKTTGSQVLHAQYNFDSDAFRADVQAWSLWSDKASPNSYSLL